MERYTRNSRKWERDFIDGGSRYADAMMNLNNEAIHWIPGRYGFNTSEFNASQSVIRAVFNVKP